MLESLAALVEESCSTDCSSDSCFRNWLIVQSHHDFCLHDEVPEAVEDSFHDYEDVCEEECIIFRRRDPVLADCPAAVCEGSKGDNAFAAMVEADCMSDCSSETCSTNYKILRTEHDNCENGGVGMTAETGLHDLEEICEAQNCNSLFTDEDVAAQLVCVPEEEEEEDDHDEHDHDEEKEEMSSGASVIVQLSKIMAAISGAALMF